MDAVDSALEKYAEKVWLGAITYLFENMRQSAVALTLFPLVIINALWDDANHQTLIGWMIAAGIGAIARWTLYLNRHRAVRSASRTRYWVWAAVASSLVTGVIWGSTAPLFLPQVSAGNLIIVNIIVVGLAAGSAVAFNYWLPHFYAYTIPSLLIFGLYYLWHGGDSELALAGLIFIYLFMLSSLAHVMNRSYRENLALRLKNESLVDELRQEKELAEAASRSKTRFLAAASHDLRQPVHSLALLREALRHEVDKKQSDELLGMMGNALEALDQLLGSLLDISKLDAGVVENKSAPMPLKPLIVSMLGEARPLAWDKGLKLRQRNCDNNYFVVSDPNLLSNILRNLINNAIRYTDEGGVLLSCRRRGENLLLQVWDTGIGIDAAEQEAIFQEFTQVGGPEREQNKGLGLGLAICRRTADLLGHPLKVHSIPKHGSVFSLLLPMYTGIVTQPEKSTAMPRQWYLNGKRLLVIDDDETVREGMVALLQRWGCHILAAASANAALRQARAADFAIDAIVTDYRLGDETTGVDAVAAILAEAGRPIPVVLVTGDTSPPRLQEARASGYPLLHKPVKPAFLRNALGRVIGDVQD